MSNSLNSCSGNKGVLFGCGTEQAQCGTQRVCNDGCLSPEFMVGDYPVVIRAFNMEPGEKILVEIADSMGLSEYFEPLKEKCGCCTVLTSESNQIVLPVSGRYRLNRCYCNEPGDVEPSGDAYVEYQEITTGALVTIGESGMGNCCGTDLTITQTDNQTIITQDGMTYIVPHGSDVEVIEVDPQTYIIRVDGEDYTLNLGSQVECVADGILIDGILCPLLSEVATSGPITGDGTPGNPVTLDEGDLISDDAGNIIETGLDGRLYAPCVSWMCRPLAP